MVVYQELVDWIRREKERGISSEKLLSYMVQNGQDPTVAREALDLSNKRPKKVFKHKKIVFIILGIIALLGIGYLVFNFLNAPETFNLEIEEGENYAVGETFLENVKITNNGKTTEILIATFSNKDNFEKHPKEIELRSIEKNGEFSLSLGAFEQNENSFTAKDRFVEPGNYEFEIKVYSCGILERKTGKSCEEISLPTIEEDLSEILPQGTITQTFVITGANIPQGCVDSTSCTRECLGCETGSQICELAEGECIDCVLDSNCKEGYFCYEGVCTEGNSNVSSQGIFDHALCGEEIIDCGEINNSINECYLDAAQNCCLAKIIVSYEIDLFGMIFASKTQQEIQGIEEDKCLLYNKYLDNTVGFSEDFLLQALENGTTQEDLDQQLNESNLQASIFIGKESVCKYPHSDLILKLEEEMEGSFSGSSEDAELYECSGTLYEI